MNLDFIQPYTSMIRMGLIGAAGLAVVGFAWSWHARGQEIEELKTWQETVVVTTARAANVKKLSVDAVPNTISTIALNAANCQTTVDAISAMAARDKIVSDARDAALRDSLGNAEVRYKSAERKIEELDRRQPAPAGMACAQIEGDSKAAWEGWRQ